MKKDSKVRKYYDNYSNNYDNFYEPLQIQKYRETIEYQTRITDWSLDLGGGTGLLSSWLSYPLVTIDISYHMLYHGYNEGRRFHGVAGDIQKLPIRDGCISTFFSYTTIQNTTSKHHALNEIIRVGSLGFSGVITVLEKTTNIQEFHKILDRLDFNFSRISANTEDIMYQISSKASSSGS